MMKDLWIFALAFAAFWMPACTSQPEETLPVETSSKSWVMDSFVKVDSLNPILRPSAELTFICPVSKKEVKWEERNVLNPTALVRGDSVYLLYRAQDMSGTSRIGMAVSSDGVHFTKRAKPILYPDNDARQKDEWSYKKLLENSASEDCINCFDGIEDPRIVESDAGTYILSYTSYDGKIARLCLASSTDLTHWTKHGRVLASDKYNDFWSKSGSIVAQRQGNRLVAKKIDGKYWMYFGDTDLFVATSDDLLSWQVLENSENGKMLSVLHPRPGYFDSRLVEPGPAAMLIDAGVLLIYNASNAADFNDSDLPRFTYAAGQALFDRDRPYQLIDRTDSYFIRPDKEYEKVGEVNEVCFVEGLVWFGDKWMLYYGTADSKIAVAIR